MSGTAFRRILLGLLMLVLVAIWVRNLFLLLPEVDPSDSVQTASHSAEDSEALRSDRTGADFALDPDLRSPFAFQRPEAPKPANVGVTPRPVHPVEPIRSSLIGCVFNAKQSHIVVLDSVSGLTEVLRTGDTLNGFVLTRITQNEIRWTSTKGRRIVWDATK